MKYVPALRFIGLVLALAGCGGESENPKSSGGTGATAATSSGGSSAAGGSTANVVIDRACSVSSDCVVQSLGCCPPCGVPNPSDFTAMSRASQYDFQRSACANSRDCAACTVQPGTNILVATCEQGRCALIDLLDNAVTVCSSNSDCYVRAPECCECGGSTDEYSVIALSSTSSVAYSTLVCSPTQACADCAPVYPAVALACVSGHCQMVGW